MLNRGGFLELRSSPFLPGSSGFILLSSCAIFFVASQYINTFFKIKFSKITIINHYALLKLHRSTFPPIYKTSLFQAALYALLCLHNRSTPIAKRCNPHVCKGSPRNLSSQFPLQNLQSLLFV